MRYIKMIYWVAFICCSPAWVMGQTVPDDIVEISQVDLSPGETRILETQNMLAQQAAAKKAVKPQALRKNGGSEKPQTAKAPVKANGDVGKAKVATKTPVAKSVKATGAVKKTKK